jgi:hypothetical protein
MLYLNSPNDDDFKGGSTYFQDKKTRKIVKSLIPEPGLLIVFLQEDMDYLHGGEEIKKGNKYILRTVKILKK